MQSRWNLVRALGALALVAALAFGGLFVTAPPARADHDTVSWYGSPWSVAADTVYTEDHSTAFADGKGHVYVFYTVRTANMFANLSVKENGTGLLYFGSPNLILSRQITSDAASAGTVNPSYAPSVAMDHSGNLYVAWVKAAPYTGGRSDDVYVSKSTDGGSTWLPPVLASASGDPAGLGSDTTPSLAVAGDGTIWMAYYQEYDFQYNITLAHSSNGAASFTGFTNVSLAPPGQAYLNEFPSLRIDAQGRLYLAYTHRDAAGYYYILAGWSDNGVAWTTQTIAPAPGVATYVYMADILVESNGNVDVAWWDNSVAGWGGNMIWFRRSADRGATWLPAVELAGPGGPAADFVEPISLVGLGANLMVTYRSYDSSYGGIGWAVSADDGQSWYPARVQTFGHLDSDISAAMDENGTVWASMTSLLGNGDIELTSWNGPPSPPAITSVASSANGLAVAWSAPPEKDVASYRVWRSADGTTYQAIATVVAPATTYADTGLANGTYWYTVTAVDAMGTSSHDSAPASGTVGPTTQELINQLQNEITSLENQLSQSDANLTAAQSQITAMQNALTNLENSQTAGDAATAAALARLQANITALQNELNNLQTQQATQTISYANFAFEVIVVVLLVVLLLNQMRKPKGPHMMMAEPARAPKKPEDSKADAGPRPRDQP